MELYSTKISINQHSHLHLKKKSVLIVWDSNNHLRKVHWKCTALIERWSKDASIHKISANQTKRNYSQSCHQTDQMRTGTFLMSIKSLSMAKKTKTKLEWPQANYFLRVIKILWSVTKSSRMALQHHSSRLYSAKVNTHLAPATDKSTATLSKKRKVKDI